MKDIIVIIIALLVAIIGYRIAARKQQSRGLDAYTIKKLQESGLDTSAEHELEFWFYSDEKSAIDSLANELEKRDFEVYLSDTEQDPKYVIRAKKIMIPDLTRLQLVRKEFSSLAKANNAEYDGWGCNV